MSTIQVANISDGTTSVPSNVVTEGGTKAFTKYNQATPASQEDYNLSSITDVSAGRWDANFTNAFAAATYAVVAATMSNDGSNVDACGGLTTGRTSSVSPMESHNAASLTDRENGAAWMGALA